MFSLSIIIQGSFTSSLLQEKNTQEAQQKPQSQLIVRLNVLLHWSADSSRENTVVSFTNTKSDKSSKVVTKQSNFTQIYNTLKCICIR